MIDLESITLRNFLSYGDYDTTIKLSNMGPCLITGDNGAGKSALINAILYPFFGRTMHGPRPGDNIVNNVTKKSCFTSATLKNGDVITRTRKLAGHNELIVERGGEQVLSTLSTTANQQEQLDRMYDLNWHAFCNTSFMTQVKSPWFEMPEPQRKKEIERALRIDRYTYRAAAAKSELDKVIQTQEKYRDELSDIQKQINTAQKDLEETRQLEANFDSDKIKRCKHAIAQAQEYKQAYCAIIIPDMVSLHKKWRNKSECAKKIDEYTVRERSKVLELNIVENKKREADRIIKLWSDRAGKLCTSCLQEIPHAHTTEQTEPYLNKKAKIDEEIEVINASLKEIRNIIGRFRVLDDDINPEMSIREADSLIARRNDLKSAAIKWVESARAIKSKTSPHTATIEKLEKRIADKTAKLETIKVEIDRLDTLIKHYTYIYKSYNDRRRIKSFSVAEIKPLLNSRLDHYLKKFKLGIDIQITDSLGVDTTGADYRFLSGGERMRVNVSFMLARFDTNEALFGRQCNVIVLDEVDGALDAVGVDCLVDIVTNDLASKVDTILIVSHKEAMKNMFPNQIVVENHNGFSMVSEMR